MEESSSAAYELPPPPLHLLQHYQQAGIAPVHQLPDAILRPPIPGSARPHVQIQQYGRHNETRPSRLPDPLVGHEEAPLSPIRPAQPPRRIVPQAPEEEQGEQEEEDEDEEAGTDDEVVPSHLFVRPPVEVTGSVSQYPGRDGHDDGDGSENDTPALPVLQRRSIEVPSGRSIPPPVPPSHLHLNHRHLPTSSSNVYEPDSDHDGQALPVRPRHTAVPLTPIPPTPVLPRPTPRRSVPSAPENGESFHVMPSVAVSEPEPGEILDEEEGGKCLFLY
jgi:myosin tail region-interacting protein MTI1